MDEDGWHLSTDAAETLDAAAQTRLGDLKKWLTKQMRTIRLPDLLIEVDNDLRFTDHFVPPAQRGGRDAEDVCPLLAVVLAHGCNIGLHTMAQITQGVTYKQLKRVSDWQMTEEAQRAALAALVHAISRLDTTIHWGEGRTSASDGQRFAMPRKVLQQTYSTRFSDFALEFYSFVADNYAPFYSTPIECTDRDSAFVLDGLFYNESDLELEEHYTDTHGYTEINFAAFAMLGRRFCPRIRGLEKQRLYRLDAKRDYGPLAGLVGRADRTIDPQVIAEQWDRMGQFYASLESGHTTASVALKRLASCTAKNRFYRANRDLGRIFKTEFLLSYLSEPPLRSRIRKGLLKVEQLHALARDVYYGRRGRINARELHEQMNSCSCLTLILACVIYWQAKEISRVVRWCKPEDEQDRRHAAGARQPHRVGQRHPVRPVRTGPRPGPLTSVLKGYFNSNLGGTLITPVAPVASFRSDPGGVECAPNPWGRFVGEGCCAAQHHVSGCFVRFWVLHGATPRRGEIGSFRRAGLSRARHPGVGRHDVFPRRTVGTRGNAGRILRGEAITPSS